MKHLTPSEFYQQVSRWANGKYTGVAQKWCNAIVEIIIQECFFKKACRVPLLGVFELVHHEESTQSHIIDGEEQILIVPERYSVKFIPADSFVNDVNGKGVTKFYRQKASSNKLTKRDIERQLRFEEDKVEEYFRQQALAKEDARKIDEERKEKDSQTKKKNKPKSKPRTKTKRERERGR